MADPLRMAKAQRELEELYSGVPDDSVNLTFGDLADVRQPPAPPPPPPFLEPIIESAAASPRREEAAPLAKLPSLDFSRALEASAQFNHNRHGYQPNFDHQNNHPMNSYNVNPQIQMSDFGGDNHRVHRDQRSGYGGGGGPHQHHHGYGHRGSNPYGTPNSGAYDDMSQMSGGFPVGGGGGGGGRRRPGIPHSKICTVCSTYVYVFRHRCLVCGRVYCRQCVSVGMGEMSEGRKCIECLGRRFSPSSNDRECTWIESRSIRYIQKAGQVGCCTGYPTLVKQQELKWAEKGPRVLGENRQGRSEMMSRSIGPNPMIPGRGPSNHTKGPPSFVSNAQASFVVGSPSPYSPYYSPRNHPLPF